MCNRDKNDHCISSCNLPFCLLILRRKDFFFLYRIRVKNKEEPFKKPEELEEMHNKLKEVVIKEGEEREVGHMISASIFESRVLRVGKRKF